MSTGEIGIVQALSGNRVVVDDIYYHKTVLDDPFSLVFCSCNLSDTEIVKYFSGLSQ